jgi:hypothetical protein
MGGIKVIVGGILMTMASTLHAAPRGDAPQQIPGWRLPQAALEALWNALGWVLILPF